MDDFEIQLKRLPLAKPSAGLKQRIFGPEKSGAGIAGFFRHRVPLGWAALFAVLAGAAGMYGTRFVGGTQPLQPKSSVYVQIIKGPTDRNMFDFTAGSPSEDFMPGVPTVTVETPEEI
jgi:hypothetical protein